MCTYVHTYINTTHSSRADGCYCFCHTHTRTHTHTHKHTYTNTHTHTHIHTRTTHPPLADAADGTIKLNNPLLLLLLLLLGHPTPPLLCNRHCTYQ